MPASVVGITRTRNWILDNTEEQRVVFVDDDVVKVGWIRLDEANGRHQDIDVEDTVAEFRKLFDVTEQLGLRVWGVDTHGALRAIYPYRPFIFRTYVTASCMGIFNRKVDGKEPLRFDETFPVKEDYELSLRAMHEDGGVLGARYFYWKNEHWKTEGGCNTYRSAVMEEKAIRDLRRKYPGRVLWRPNKASPYSIALNV